MINMTRFFTLVGLAVIAGSSGQPMTDESEGYGLDCSFPIHSKVRDCYQVVKAILLTNIALRHYSHCLL